MIILPKIISSGIIIRGIIISSGIITLPIIIRKEIIIGGPVTWRRGYMEAWKGRCACEGISSRTVICIFVVSLSAICRLIGGILKEIGTIFWFLGRFQVFV